MIHLFTLSLSLLLSGPSSQNLKHEDLLGYWEGALFNDRGIQIVRVRFSEREGQLWGAFSRPDWGIRERDLPIKLETNTVIFDFPYKETKLVLDREAGILNGIAPWRSNAPLKLQLKRTVEPVFPKTQEKEIRFQSQDITLAGSLILPNGTGPHPGLIMVSGRSYGTRNSQKSMAIQLARRGIAALIFDGRGKGQSQGDPRTLTEEGRYADAEAAFQFAMSRPEFDPQRLGFWGTSAGGWVVSVVANRLENVALLVLEVAPAGTLADQQGQVVSYKMKASDQAFTAAEIQAAFEYQHRLVHLAWEGAEWSKIEPHVALARKQRWAKFVDLPDRWAHPELDYFRRRKYDPRPELEKLTLPIFAFYGEADVVVPAQENAKHLESLLVRAGNKDFTILSLPMASHGMWYPKRAADKDQAWPHSYYRFAKRVPYVDDTLFRWLAQRFNINPQP